MHTNIINAKVTACVFVSSSHFNGRTVRSIPGIGHKILIIREHVPLGRFPKNKLFLLKREHENSNQT